MEGNPLELLARLPQHIPNHYEHQERFYGRYSPVTRGELEKEKINEPEKLDSESNETYKPFCSEITSFKSSWGSCIKLVYEVDPLESPECKGEMKIIAFIRDHHEKHKILPAAGLPSYRTPPPF